MPLSPHLLAVDCIIISFMMEYQSLVSKLCPRARFYDVDHRLLLTTSC